MFTKKPGITYSNTDSGELLTNKHFSSTHERFETNLFFKIPTNVVFFQCFYLTTISNNDDDSKCVTFVQSA